MKGLVCPIAGATSGVGKASALELATRGPTVVVVGRNRQRCIKTVEQILQDTGDPSVGYLAADFPLRTAFASSLRTSRFSILTLTF